MTNIFEPFEGTLYLRRRLSALLAGHIRDCLPQIAMKINVLKRQFQHQLLTCGKPIDDANSTLLQLLTKFAGDYQVYLRMKYNYQYN